MNVVLTEAPVQEDKGASAQVAALCWRLHKGHVQVLLITSRDTGRWVIPKGWPIAGLSDAASAAREAWEEAGVEGQVSDCALGAYLYDKVTRPASHVRCAVAVHPLRVKALKKRFPEAHERRRGWFAAGQAAHLVAEAELRHLLVRVDAQPALLLGAA